MRLVAALTAVALTGGLADCGSRTASPPTGATTSPAETNPTGDIPDNIAYVIYSPPSGRYTIKVPEGWSRSEPPPRSTSPTSPPPGPQSAPASPPSTSSV